MNTSHREAFPEQYTHSLCGARVRAPDGTEFVVERVVASRFGLLAPVPPTGRTAYRIDTLDVLEDNTQAPNGER